MANLFYDAIVGCGCGFDGRGAGGAVRGCKAGLADVGFERRDLGPERGGFTPFALGAHARLVDAGDQDDAEAGGGQVRRNPPPDGCCQGEEPSHRLPPV